MTNYTTVASDEVITKTADALQANGFSVTVVADGEAAKTAALAIIPTGAEVLTTSSKTLITLGLDKILNESGDYDAVRPKLNALMSDPSRKGEQRKLGAAPDYAIGSVHAITEDGTVLIASMSGSQIGPYAYGAGHVVWIVGAQKIVHDWNEAVERLNDHVFPLEDERAQQAYGVHSSINKLLRYNKEFPGRVDIILVKEALGF